MKISTARKIGFEVLLRVTTQDAYADEALRALLAKTASSTVGPEDAGLATELVFGALRWQRLLDFLIDRHLTKSSKALDAEVRIALRLGVYQLHFLTRVPARAAVHESVELVKLARKRSAAPLVNAVLRKIAKESAQKKSLEDTIVPLLPREISQADELGIRYSHPTWLVERWLRAFGEERTQALLEANNRVPALSGYFVGSHHRDDALSSLQMAGCTIKPGHLLRDSCTLEGGNPAASEAARRGWLAIQDEASQAVARLVGVEPADSVLDLCAAPGGKTLRLALDAGPDGHVIAADLHAHRVRAMSERLERTGIRNVETLTLDATGRIPFERRFDRILVDVPCSGTGTLARHPEIRWRLRQEDLQDLHARQRRLLQNALPHLASAGRLVYSTCSLEPEENENVVNEVLGALGSAYRLVSVRSTVEGLLKESVPADSVISADGFFRTFPAEHGTDGFFAAAIERKQ